MCTQRLVRLLVTLGARCRKAARRDLLGGMLREGHVYQPKPHVRILCGAHDCKGCVYSTWYSSIARRSGWYV